MKGVLLVAALLLAVPLLGGCGGGGDAGGASSGANTVQISGTDFKLDPSKVSVSAGRTTFTFTNDGQTTHALEIEGNGVEEASDTIGPGESASVTVDLEPGTYAIYCPVGDHRSRGMEGTLTAGGGASGAGTSTGSTETDGGSGYGG